MAPEILLAETYSYNCDIWSIAVCFYELICGKYPFINYDDDDSEDDDPLILYKAILNAPLTIPNYIKDEKFINLISKLLTRNPTERLCNINLIKSDIYFKNFDWDSLYDLTYKAPYIPN
jgi:serine/threonine protein kinase